MLKKLEMELSEQQKADAKVQSALSNKKENLKSEVKNLEQLEKQRTKVLKCFCLYHVFMQEINTRQIQCDV